MKNKLREPDFKGGRGFSPAGHAGPALRQAQGTVSLSNGEGPASIWPQVI
jgi:hypothetical protein